MERNDALTIFFERSTTMQTYWNFYVTIVLAYISLFGSINPSTTTTYAATLFTAAFLVFAVVMTGGRLVKHARYYWLLFAEGHLTHRLFGAMVRRIWTLPFPAW